MTVWDQLELASDCVDVLTPFELIAAHLLGHELSGRNVVSGDWILFNGQALEIRKRKTFSDRTMDLTVRDRLGRVFLITIHADEPLRLIDPSIVGMSRDAFLR